jgi:hypothetical protein
MSGRPPDRHRDSLSPELRRQIEGQLDDAALRTRRLANASLRYAKYAVWILLVLVALAFVTDYFMLRWNHDPLGKVTIKRYYSISLKNGKTEMDYAEPEVQACVNSVFPHRGYSPCWYLRRHNLKEINV